MNRTSSMTIEAIKAPPEIPDLRRKPAREELGRVVDTLAQEARVRTCHLARIKPERREGEAHAYTTILDVTFVGPTEGKVLPVGQMLEQIADAYELSGGEVKAGGKYGVVDVTDPEEQPHSSSAPVVQSVFCFVTGDHEYEQIDSMLMNPSPQSPAQIHADTPFAFYVMKELGLVTSG